MEIISQGGSGYDLFERYADRIVLKKDVDTFGKKVFRVREETQKMRPLQK